MSILKYLIGKIAPRKKELFTNDEIEKFVKKAHLNGKDAEADLKTIKEFAQITFERMGLDRQEEKEKPTNYYLERHKRKNRKK